MNQIRWLVLLSKPPPALPPPPSRPGPCSAKRPGLATVSRGLRTAGHRVPFFVRWPGRVPAGSRVEQAICLTDFFDTCADVVQRPLPNDAAEDSFSFLPAALGARGRAVAARPPIVHHSVAGMFALRKGRWKLVAGNGSGGRQQPKGKPFGEPFQLFDLERDLGEERDVAAEHPGVVAALRAELEALRAAGRSRPAAAR